GGLDGGQKHAAGSKWSAADYAINFLIFRLLLNSPNKA
ncbi:MAG: hypothetical protein ACI9I0_002186, partial [Rhodoferax sp.]